MAIMLNDEQELLLRKALERVSQVNINLNNIELAIEKLKKLSNEIAVLRQPDHKLLLIAIQDATEFPMQLLEEIAALIKEHGTLQRLIREEC